jgi:hypothetical protein
MGELDISKKIEEVVGKKNFKKFRRLAKSPVDDLAVAISVITIIAALAATTSILYTRETKSTAPKTVTNNIKPAVVLKTSDVASTNEYEVSVTGTYESTSAIKGLSRLRPDEVFLVFSLTVKNKTAISQPFYVSNQIFARDPKTGLLFTFSPAETSNPFPSGMIEPGQTASGQLSFVMPKSLTRPLVYVDLGWDDVVPIVFSPLQ